MHFEDDDRTNRVVVGMLCNIIGWLMLHAYGICEVYKPGIFDVTDEMMWPGFTRLLLIFPMLFAVLGAIATLRADSIEDLMSSWMYRNIHVRSIRLLEFLQS